MMAGLYMHYQFGGTKDYYINASELDFSMTSQNDLGLTQTPDVVQYVNLFNTGINELSLSFGNVGMVYQGNDQFSIQDRFDFDRRPEASFSRNAGTFLGGLAFGRIFNTPAPYLPPIFYLQPNYYFGGPFDIKFNGTVTIKP
jgi:hypothetical protein